MTPRECLRADGTPKQPFPSFDAAHEHATRRQGYHAYRCTEHGWHVGSNHSRRPGLQTLERALDALHG